MFHYFLQLDYHLHYYWWLTGGTSCCGVATACPPHEGAVGFKALLKAGQAGRGTMGGGGIISGGGIIACRGIICYLGAPQKGIGPHCIGEYAGCDGAFLVVFFCFGQSCWKCPFSSH